jgi:polyhydroxyalkanoate synthesis regulator phasin
MSEEQTERFEGGTPFEIRVLRELANINQRLNGLESRMDRLEGRLDGLESRLTSLEDKVEARLHDTRPIWEAVLLRLDSMDARLTKMDAKFDVVASEMLDLRADVEMLKKRPPAA